MAQEPKTHLGIVNGQMTQMGIDTSFPTTREDPIYIVGNDDGLDDGEIFYNSTNGVLGIHQGGVWLFIEFTHTL